MQKTLFLLTFIVFTILACNNSVEDSNQVEDSDIAVNQLDTIEQITNEPETQLIVEPISKNTQSISALQLLDEEVLFSFKTEKGKIMNILLQKDEKYMVYRFGTDEKLELQFPEELSNTFKQFSYNYYFRGGGAANAGLDLNYLSFSGDTHKFIIFQEYSAEGEEGEGESESVGIRIVNLKTKKEIKIKGISSTVSGDLMIFRDNGLVKIVDEI